MVTLLPLTLNQVTVKRRGKTLLGPVDLTIKGSGLTVVVGPNGSGKTTLLRSLHGIERLTSGTLTWACDGATARQHQAYVFQQPTMLRRTVLENLRFPLDLLGQDRGRATAQAADWARRIGLGDALERPAQRLSGGERQKLALARALIRAPQLLFLDEPCANLDGRATQDIERLLLDVRATGTRIIMATHDMGQARRLADTGLFLRAGMVHESNQANAFFDSPKTPELAAFLKGDIVL